jgi:acyl carrier protein
MSDVFVRTRKVIADVFGVPEESVTPESSRDEVKGWDSVNVIHLIMALEGEFNIALSPDEAADLLSVPLILEILKEKGVQ